MCHGVPRVFGAPKSPGLPRSPEASAKQMLVIPNLKGSIYTRIWCVYEAYLAYTWKKPIYTVARQHQIWSVGSHDTKVVILVFVYLILFVFHLLQVPCQTMGTYGNVMIRIYFINLHNALAKLADCIQL